MKPGGRPVVRRCGGWPLLLGAWLAALSLAAWSGPLSLVEVAPGVFVHQGRHEETSATNGGDIANIGFIVGERCVAVVDTGGSLALGQALAAALRAHSGRPVCYVINTHMHPDHVFGNGAFRAPADAPAPRFVGSARLPPALAARAAHYRAALATALGPAAAETPVVAPDLLVDGELRLDLGGRTLILRSWPTAHTDNDLTVYDEATGTLWLGDLLFHGRIPAVDGSLVGWLKAIAELRRTPAQRVIPGHGNLDLPWPEALDAQERYLAGLAERVRAALRSGKTLAQTVDAADPAEAAGWQLADGYHKRNLTAAYAELEWE